MLLLLEMGVIVKSYVIFFVCVFVIFHKYGMFFSDIGTGKKKKQKKFCNVLQKILICSEREHIIFLFSVKETMNLVYF